MTIRRKVIARAGPFSSRLDEAAATAAVRVANIDHLKSFEVQPL
jgi:hypothetical protein